MKILFAEDKEDYEPRRNHYILEHIWNFESLNFFRVNKSSFKNIYTLQYLACFEYGNLH
jgi:hypothetical protein